MMQNHPCEYDIAIVGGGLAGLTLAIRSTQEGYRVILFEKEQFPFHKVCGEYISMESWNFLTRCGLPLEEWSLPVIKKLEVSDTRGNSYDFPLTSGGFGLSRYRLDNALYELALHKGVAIHTNCKVTDVVYEEDVFFLHTQAGKFSAKVAAGCFGKRSNLDVKWNRGFTSAKPNKINHYIGVKYHIQFQHPANMISLHNFSNGYCGISRIEDEKCCLCYLTTAENLQRSGNSIPDMEKNILSKNRQLHRIFSEAKYLYEQPLAISQVSFQKKTQVENHVLMLGDAAGLITPLCGNGMSMAMHSGKMALDNIRLLLSGRVSREQMEKRYTQQWQHEFGSRTKVGRVVQYFFGGSLSTAVFLRTMHSFPFFSQLLIEKTHGNNF